MTPRAFGRETIFADMQSTMDPLMPQRSPFNLMGSPQTHRMTPQPVTSDADSVRCVNP